MKAFGIEIRKSSSVNLFKDVDAVLAKHGVKHGEITAELQMSTCAIALKKMMRRDNFFSVCTISDCAKLCAIVVPRDRMNVYQSVHCVNWSDMDGEYRELICALVLDDFRSILCPAV